MTKTTDTSANTATFNGVPYPNLTCEHGTYHIEERCPDCLIECPETYLKVLALIGELP